MSGAVSHETGWHMAFSADGLKGMSAEDTAVGRAAPHLQHTGPKPGPSVHYTTQMGEVEQLVAVHERDRTGKTIWAERTKDG